MEKQKTKKVKLLIAIAILIILFIGFGIFIKSTPESREHKVISYLKEKYNTDFEIIRLIDSGENVLFSEISCDGATFCPEIKDKGTYYYRYEVLSLSDNITFEVNYLDKKIKDTITESYFPKKYGDYILNDISNYIVSTIGDNETVTEFNKSNYKNYGLEGWIEVNINKDLDNIYNKEYMKKLEAISSYIKNKEAMENDIDITVYINFKNNMQVYYLPNNPIIRKSTDEGDIIENYTFEEYLEEVKK